MRSNSRHLARRKVVQALYQWDMTGQAANEIEAGFINDQDFAGVQRSYFHHLIEHVPRECRVLDSHLENCLTRKLDSVDPVERAILRLAAYELLYRPDVPRKVVLNEAVELARVFGAEEGYRFVNGVLDALLNRVSEDDTEDEILVAANNSEWTNLD